VDFVLVSKTGGGNIESATYVHKSRPDGYTIGWASLPGAFFTQKVVDVYFDLLKTSWIAGVGPVLDALLVRADSPVKTMDDLKALSEQQQLKHCNCGIGTTSDVLNAIIMARAGITNYVDIPYSGTATAVTGLLRGDGDFFSCSHLGLPEDYVKKGDLRAITTLTAERTKLYPDVPSTGELGLGPLPEKIRGIFAAPGTPEEIRKILEDAFLKAVQDPDLKAWGEETGRPTDLMPGADVLASIKAAEEAFKEFEDIIKEHLAPVK